MASAVNRTHSRESLVLIWSRVPIRWSQGLLSEPRACRAPRCRQTRHLGSPPAQTPAPRMHACLATMETSSIGVVTQCTSTPLLVMSPNQSTLLSLATTKSCGSEHTSNLTRYLRSSHTHTDDHQFETVSDPLFRANSRVVLLAHVSVLDRDREREARELAEVARAASLHLVHREFLARFLREPHELHGCRPACTRSHVSASRSL